MKCWMQRKTPMTQCNRLDADRAYRTMIAAAPKVPARKMVGCRLRARRRMVRIAYCVSQMAERYKRTGSLKILLGSEQYVA